MAAKCEICGRGASVGNTVSHAHNKTKRRWNPNLQRLRIIKNGKVRRAMVCTRCIRSSAVTKAA